MPAWRKRPRPGPAKLGAMGVFDKWKNQLAERAAKVAQEQGTAAAKLAARKSAEAALAAANAMVVAKATRTLDARIGRACFGELIGVLPLDC